MKWVRFLVRFVPLIFLLSSRLLAAEGLPWETNYPVALAKAKQEKRPLFLMLTATWCGPCKMLEGQTLPDPTIRDGLKEFVWVKAYEDAELNKKYELGGYPTLVFIDPAKDRVLYKHVGYAPPGTFLREVIAARKAADLPLTSHMAELQAKSFQPDGKKVTDMINAGDFAGLTNYLAPIKDDAMRQVNFVVARVHPPPSLKPADVVVMAAGDESLPDSGILVAGFPLHAMDASLNLIAPGCQVINEPLNFEAGSAVLARELTLAPLSTNQAARFNGRVLRADGSPAAKAIVRICDWAITRTDEQGRFNFSMVSPGTFLVRAEYPGGEFQDHLAFAAGEELKRDLSLAPVTTIGIRWAVQRNEGSREFTGDNVRTGEAYFSVKHSRFLLERGAETRVYWGSDFMMSDDLKNLRQYIAPDQLAVLEASPQGTPFFWLFDACDRKTGLHAETASFDALLAVNGGKEYDQKTFFKFLRGEPVQKGRVYSVRGVRRDLYAKLEITDVTLVPKVNPD